MFCCLGKNIIYGWKWGNLHIWWNRPSTLINDDKDQNSGIHQNSFISYTPSPHFQRFKLSWCFDIFFIYVMVHLYILYICLFIFITNNIHQYSHFRWPHLAAWRRRIPSTRRNWPSCSHQRIFDILLKSVCTKKAK